MLVKCFLIMANAYQLAIKLQIENNNFRYLAHLTVF